MLSNAFAFYKSRANFLRKKFLAGKIYKRVAVKSKNILLIENLNKSTGIYLYFN